MARASTDDPIKVFRYRIDITDFTRAGFSEASGLSVEIEEAKYREGAMNGTPQKSAGLANFGDISLKRGQLIGSTQGGDSDFLTWISQVFLVTTAGTAANYRKDITYSQYNSQNKLAAKWRVFQCWPKMNKPFSDLSALSSDNSIEELTLVNEGWIRVG